MFRRDLPPNGTFLCVCGGSDAVVGAQAHGSTPRLRGVQRADADGRRSQRQELALPSDGSPTSSGSSGRRLAGLDLIHGLVLVKGKRVEVQHEAGVLLVVSLELGPRRRGGRLLGLRMERMVVKLVRGRRKRRVLLERSVRVAAPVHLHLDLIKMIRVHGFAGGGGARAGAVGCRGAAQDEAGHLFSPSFLFIVLYSPFPPELDTTYLYNVIEMGGYKL